MFIKGVFLAVLLGMTPLWANDALGEKFEVAAGFRQTVLTPHERLACLSELAREYATIRESWWEWAKRLVGVDNSAPFKDQILKCLEEHPADLPIFMTYMIRETLAYFGTQTCEDWQFTSLFTVLDLIQKTPVGSLAPHLNQDLLLRTAQGNGSVAFARSLDDITPYATSETAVFFYVPTPEIGLLLHTLKHRWNAALNNSSCSVFLIQPMIKKNIEQDKNFLETTRYFKGLNLDRSCFEDDTVWPERQLSFNQGVFFYGDKLPRIINHRDDYPVLYNEPLKDFIIPIIQKAQEARPNLKKVVLIGGNFPNSYSLIAHAHDRIKQHMPECTPLTFVWDQAASDLTFYAGLPKGGWDSLFHGDTQARIERDLQHLQTSSKGLKRATQEEYTL